jgi:hypothetical protein
MTQIVNLPTLTTSTTTNIVIPVADLNTNPGTSKKITLQNLVSLAVGPQGTQGVPGLQGPLGYTGSRGIGYVGSASTSSGYNGSRGYTGSPGFYGSRGYNGSIGYVGSPGPGANQSLNTTSNVTFASVAFTDGTSQSTAYPKSVLTLNNLSIGDYDISASTIKSNILVTPTNMSANRKLNLPAPNIAYGTQITIRNRDSVYTLDLRYNGYNGPLVAVIQPNSNINLSCDNSTWFAVSSGGGGNGYTGSSGYIGSPGSPGGFTGSAGVGYTGSAGSGYTGSPGVGYTGSASSGYTGSPGVGYTGSASSTAGYTGSPGSPGGFTGSSGYIGSPGVVNALANGTYTITTLYVSTLTVTSVGASTIASGNDLNFKAAGQIKVNAPFVLTTSTTAGLSAIGPITQQGAMVFVTDASGGAQPCYYDGTHWYTVNGRTQIA